MGKKSLRSNLIYNTVYQITIMILPFLTAPYISRIIGADGLGTYSYSHAIALYFVYFAMLGLSNYGNREIAKNSDDNKALNKVFSSIYFLQLITSILIGIIYLGYVFLIAKGNRNINIIMFLHVISAVFDVSWLFFGLQEFKITSIRQIIIKILSFISIFIFVKNKNDLWIYTFIMSLSYFLSAFSLWIMMFKKVKIIKCDIKDVLKHLKPCLILFIPIIATSVYRVMDKIMIGSFCDMAQVGYYENAEKIILISLGILNAFSAVVMPKIANLLSNKRNEEALELTDKSMKVSMFICFVVSFGIAAVAKEFIPIFFGEEFYESINICSLLCISVPFITWSTMIRNLYLIPHEEDKIYVKSVIIGAIVNFILNLIFIRKYEALGAVIGTLSAEITLALYQTIKVRNKVNIKKYSKYAVYFGIIGLVMFVGVEKIANNLAMCSELLLFVKIFIGGIIYCGLSIIYFIKTKDIKLINLFKR
jgi:O-antigen/teichoic acid export membrane protein